MNDQHGNNNTNVFSVNSRQNSQNFNRQINQSRNFRGRRGNNFSRGSRRGYEYEGRVFRRDYGQEREDRRFGYGGRVFRGRQDLNRYGRRNQGWFGRQERRGFGHRESQRDQRENYRRY